MTMVERWWWWRGVVLVGAGAGRVRVRVREFRVGGRGGGGGGVVLLEVLHIKKSDRWKRQPLERSNIQIFK